MVFLVIRLLMVILLFCGYSFVSFFRFMIWYFMWNGFLNLCSFGVCMCSGICLFLKLM